MGKNDYEYYILASTKNQMGFSEEALDFIERGLLLNDRSAILLGLKAYIVGQQNPGMAMELFGKALSSDPGIAKIHYQYAVFLLNRYSVDMALRSFQKAEELGYSSKTFWLDYASAYMKTAQYKKAIDILQKGLPSSEDLHYKYYEEMGNAKFDLGDSQGALVLYKKTADLNPYYSIVYAKAADVYTKATMYKAAESFFMKAIDVEPSRYTYYLKLAMVEKKLAKEDEAREAIATAYLLAPNKLEIYETAKKLGIIFP